MEFELSGIFGVKVVTKNHKKVVTKSKSGQQKCLGPWGPILCI